jgi:hypothetical protein
MSAQPHRPEPTRTPTRHRLLTEIGQPDNGYRAHVDLVDQTTVAFRRDGEKVHGAVTQALRLLIETGSVELSTPEPYQHHKPRALSLTEFGRGLLARWTSTHREPALSAHSGGDAR